ALQDTVDERGETIRLVDDDLRVLTKLRRRQLTFEQLRGTAQPAERVLHLVRELAHDSARQTLLREQVELAADAPIPLRVEELEQDPRLGIDRLGPAVDDQLPVAGLRLELAQAEREAGVEHAAAK